MKIQLAVLAVSCAALHSAAQSGNLSDWQKLLNDKKNPDAARVLCTSFEQSKVLAEQVEAEKCLANVALCGHGVMELEKDDAGGGTLRDSYAPEAVDEALMHLNLGIKLAPQDLSIHQGRLHVLEIAGRYSEMVKALDESCTIYQGKDALEAWLAYAPELMDLRQYNAGLESMKVLDKHYPNNSDILGNIGAFLDLLKRDNEAIPYLQKAVALAPRDPINSWDLGRAYDYSGQIEEADTWYKKSLPIMSDPEQKKQSLCLYAEFVEKKLKDRARACTLQKQDCEAEEQTACSTPSSSLPSLPRNQ
jgi:tetratricopeptide (TPR) repeat protein